MGRIRTIKPEFFRHEGLFDLEKETGLPVRVAYAGLFCCCDRDGRFEWKPRQLKLDVLPWDDVEFSRVLDALLTRGFIRKYASEGREFGFIPSWSRHQIVNNREKESELPDPKDCELLADASPTRAARVTEVAQGKGKEGERKGKEGEGELTSADASATREVWHAYSEAYRFRYAAEPVRNAKVNGQISAFCKRIPCNEAPHIAAFYVGHNNAYYTKRGHSLDCLLSDAEKLRTEWATNTRMTETRARQVDQTDEQAQVWQRVAERLLPHDA